MRVGTARGRLLPDVRVRRQNKIQSMILKSDQADERSKQQQRQALLQMISYAENEFECRRKLMLAYFHEAFDIMQCKGTRDNCGSGRCHESKDVTAIGCGILQTIGGGEQGSPSV